MFVYYKISELSFKILFSEADSKCSGKLSWIKHKQTINVTQTVTLNLNSSLVYLLAVSANLPSVSSGMVWSQCTVKQVHKNCMIQTSTRIVCCSIYSYEPI